MKGLKSEETGATGRLPPGQYYTPYFTIYKALGQPEIDEHKWRLQIQRNGRVLKTLTLGELLELGTVRVVEDFHCVTGWSVPKVEWEGVPIRRLVEDVGLDDGFEWVFAEGYDGYTTVFHREDALHPHALIALKLNGKPLEPEQGFPARLVFTHLYGWKGAKWLKSLNFLDEYRDGYWEALGYHKRGRVWAEERFKRTVTG